MGVWKIEAEEAEMSLFDEISREMKLSRYSGNCYNEGSVIGV